MGDVALRGRRVAPGLTRTSPSPLTWAVRRTKALPWPWSRPPGWVRPTWGSLTRRPRSAGSRRRGSSGGVGTFTPYLRPKSRTTTHTSTPSTGNRGFVLPPAARPPGPSAPATPVSRRALRAGRSGPRRSSTSRSIPPPTPVIAPSRTACTGPTPNCSALVAPVTANRPSPSASKIITLRSARSSARPAKKQTNPAAAVAAR